MSLIATRVMRDLLISGRRSWSRQRRSRMIRDHVRSTTHLRERTTRPSAPGGRWNRWAATVADVVKRPPAVHAQTRPVGRRPIIELEPTDHPLAVEQRTGTRQGRQQ